MTDPPRVVLPSLAGGQAESWAALVELAPSLGDNWLLVGGQMVFLHEVERQSSGGFVQDAPGPTGTAHRYRRSGAVIDVLAPDNMGARAQLTLGAGRTIEAPGTTQAFRRSSAVVVEVDDVAAAIRRPDLVGGLLGKAAAVTKIGSQSTASRAKHLRDVDSLAKLLGIRDRQQADLSKSERRMLALLRDEGQLSQLASTSIQLLVDGGDE